MEFCVGQCRVAEGQGRGEWAAGGLGNKQLSERVFTGEIREGLIPRLGHELAFTLINEAKAADG